MSDEFVPIASKPFIWFEILAFGPTSLGRFNVVQFAAPLQNETPEEFPR
jgi:hypothetical protein